jgi:hypothetical protein
MKAVTLADVCKQAGDGPRVLFTHVRGGVEFQTWLRKNSQALYCPQCGEPTATLHHHPRGRGLICPACLKVARRYDQHQAR